MSVYGERLEDSRKFYQELRGLQNDLRGARDLLVDPRNSMDFVRFLSPKSLIKIDEAKDRLNELIPRLEKLEKTGSIGSLRCCLEQLKISFSYIRISAFINHTFKEIDKELLKLEEAA